MPSTRSLLALLVVVSSVSLAGCSALGPEGPPTVTVDNEDDVQYRLTIYTVPDANTPGEVPFRATTAGGERRYVAPGELQSGASYRNVTVTADDQSTREVSVAAGDTTSATVDAWERGDAIAYVVETPDETESLVALKVMTCESPGQTATITVRNGSRIRTTASCP